MTIVLLPGMDGTGTLFDPFVKELPEHLSVLIAKYPVDLPLSYEQLADRVLQQLPKETPYIIIAESYSGPIALLLATRGVGDLRTIVLVASFVSRPLGTLGSWLARLPLATVFRLPSPHWLLRWLLMEPGTPAQIVAAVQEAISKVHANILAARMKEVLTLDYFGACPVRLVCLTGTRDRLLGRRGERTLRRITDEIFTIQGPHLLLQCVPRAAATVMAELGLFD